eukprot:3532608-Karenia_brevis.AAC.1
MVYTGHCPPGHQGGQHTTGNIQESGMLPQGIFRKMNAKALDEEEVYQHTGIAWAAQSVFR